MTSAACTKAETPLPQGRDPTSARQSPFHEVRLNGWRTRPATVADTLRATAAFPPCDIHVRQGDVVASDGQKIQSARLQLPARSRMALWRSDLQSRSRRDAALCAATA